MGFLSDIPILGGIVDTLTGKPVPVQQQTIAPWQMQSFDSSPQQNKFLDYLSNQAYGQNPANNDYTAYLKGQMINPQDSAAQGFLNQKSNETNAAAAGLMGSARGVQNPMELARQAANMQTMNSQNAVNQASMLKAQEAQANRQAYGNQLQTNFNQGLANQQILGNQLNQNQQNQIGKANLQAGISSANTQANNQANQAARQGQMQFLGGLGQMGATLGAASIMGPAAVASDVRLKDNIQNGSGQIQNFLDSINPYQYDYKPQLDDGYSHLGVMAQDLEKSPMGANMVVNGPNGKAIRPDLSTLLAAEAHNNQRLNQLEAGRSPSSIQNPFVAEMPTMEIPGYLRRESLPDRYPYYELPTTIRDNPMVVPPTTNKNPPLTVPAQTMKGVPSAVPAQTIKNEPMEIPGSVNRNPPMVMPPTTNKQVQVDPQDLGKISSFLDMVDRINKTKFA